MALDNIHIQPTNTTPEIILSPEGFIKIKGRAIDESRSKLPEQVSGWVEDYILMPAQLTKVTIALEFLNSFNTIVLTQTLRKLAQLVQLGKQLSIKWYYEEDDIDIFERGEYIAATINVPIDFIVAEKISDC